MDLGFQAVISTQFADIFRTNALENGLLVIPSPRARTAGFIDHPGAELAIDLESGALHWPGGDAIPLRHRRPFAALTVCCTDSRASTTCCAHEQDIARYERTR